MLSILPPDTWRELIIGCKEGRFPEEHCLKETDQVLITELLTTNCDNQPYILEEVMDAANCIVATEEGKKFGNVGLYAI